MGRFGNPFGWAKRRAGPTALPKSAAEDTKKSRRLIIASSTRAIRNVIRNAKLFSILLKTVIGVAPPKSRMTAISAL
jgi:hypothetical protein